MLKNILKGIKAYTGTFALISKLKLWKYFLVPILISVLTAAIVVLLAIWLSGSIGGFIAQIWIWDWGKEVFTTVSNFLGATIIVVIGLLLYKHIVMALSAPFMSPVSEKIEAHLTGVPAHSHTNTSFSEQLWRGIRINVRNLVKEILFTIPILLLGLIPVVGIASTILLFLMQTYYAGFGNMDYTLERHLKYKESIVLVRKNRGLAIGNGIIFMLFLFVPLVGIILVLPLSVTAATVKTIEILKKDTLTVKK
ncbi:MAG: EI24 domain-containing protein [Cellulophaga sp.]|uniref:EI24 domain-containing protein n=1 Tax=Cellulophaga sp. TaxID=1972202 RepID=UPI003267B157